MKIPQKTYLEVTCSLDVSRRNGQFILQWNRNKRPFKVEIPEAEFSFYKQMKISESLERTLSEQALSRRRALMLSLEILGLEDNGGEWSVPRRASIEPYPSISFVFTLISCFVILWLIGFAHWMAVFALALIGSLEFFSWKGKCLSSSIFSFFPVMGFPWIALIGGSVYGILQFLDPNPLWRSYRITASFLGSFLGLFGGPKKLAF